MTEDIHKWTDGRYTLMFDEHTFFVWDNEREERMTALEVTKKLNKQQDTIITLKRRLEKINGGYGHLTHRNGLTANEWLIESQERELKKKNEQISSWIERHSKDIAKIGEQQAIIKRLEAENEQLKNRLYDFEKRKIIKESEIDEDVIPKIKLLRTELFGEKYE